MLIRTFALLAAGAALGLQAGCASHAPAVTHLNSGKVLPTGLPFSEAVRVGNTVYLSGQLGNVPGPGPIKLAPGGMALPGEAFVLNAFTGMIGMPVQTLDGVLVRSLLNPGLRRGQQIKLEHDSIQQAALSPSYKGMTAYNAPLDRDGYYNVYQL